MITTVYSDSVLQIDKRYLVQNVTKFPKLRSYMIGQYCVLKQIVGSTAHVMFTGRMCEIPVRSLIDVTGYHAKSVNAKNADGFVVIKQNTLGIPVGTAYINHDKEKSTTEYVVVHVNGKEVKIPFDILAALVSNRKKEKVVKATKLVKSTGLPSEVIALTDELVAPIKNRLDINEIPASVLKMLPGINIQELRDHIKTQMSENVVYFDYEGNDHPTIAECDKANSKIRHKELEKLLTKEVLDKFKEEWNESRTK